MRNQTKSKSIRHQLTIFAVVLLAAAPSFAQSTALDDFKRLASEALGFIQIISLILSGLGVMMAGRAYNTGDHGANEKMMNALKGAAVTAGAATIIYFVRGFFTSTGQSWTF